MEPEIRYVRSADGTKIAVGSAGNGIPLLWLPGGSGDMEHSWVLPQMRAGFERLASFRRVIMFDPRGLGLSDRDATDLSLPTQLADIDAVLAGLQIERVQLIARGVKGPYGIAYAATRPQRVLRLVLWNAAARGRDFHISSDRRDLWPLMKTNWELYVQAMALIDFGWTENGKRSAELVIKNITQEMFLRTFSAHAQTDATESLGAITCPTLVVHQPGPHAPASLDTMREIASRIPDARFKVGPMTRRSPVPFAEDSEADLTLLRAFLDEDAPADPPITVAPGTAIIMFADIVDSTGLTERLGDAAFRAKARDLDAALRRVIRERNGTPVDGKLLGDGVLAVFASASDAINAALGCATAGDTAALPLHLGIHAGDVIREDNNVYGGAVNIAARIAAASAPGEILVSDTVRNLARTSAGATFEDRGEHTLKGVGEVVRIFAARCREHNT
jgi:class 3 adenylate cyclase